MTTFQVPLPHTLADAGAPQERERSDAANMPWRLYAVLWAAFWVLLFSLGVREYLLTGGHDLRSLTFKYGAAATVSTAIGVVQLVRAARIDALLGQPGRWFARIWRWMPLEILGFVVAMRTLPGAFAWLAGGPFDVDDWRDIAYSTGKFVFFYLFCGGIQFAIRSHDAWTRERLRAAENARLAREAQLAQLTQQLHPHFMFNAINTIASLIHTDPALADTLLGRLATLLRAATSASRKPEQPLGDELELLRAYADIMRERFGDRVRIAWSIDARALACPVPTLGLQPLLENCFRHVVERRRGPTRIEIRARVQGDDAVVEIEDDGDLATPPVSANVGLGNLRRRLSSLHGSRAALELLAAPTRGLVARVRVPCAS